MTTEQSSAKSGHPEQTELSRPGWGEIFADFQAHHDPFRVFEQRTAMVDTIVAVAVAEHLQPRLSCPFAAVAVGGYGRRELFPYSDVDLLLLFGNEGHLASAKDPISIFCRVLWDAGLHLSHSVRTVQECCRLQDGNTELHISLLDVRFLCGSRELFEHFTHSLSDFYKRSADEITARLSEITRNRHTKYNETVYHLEPNIKDCPGGVRDLHLLHWLHQLHPDNDAVDENLVGLGEARRFLYTLRCFLHFTVGRDSNLLTFELQDGASASLAGQSLDPGEWMRMYYGHARRVFQYSAHALESVHFSDPSLLSQFRHWRNRLSTNQFTIARDRIFLRNPAETLGSPTAILDLFAFVGRHNVRLSWDAKRRIRGQIDRIEALFRERPPAWSSWRSLFSQPNTALALHQMQETGVLTAAIPEWSHIDSLVVRDFYHRYTVDEHTIVSIGIIDNLLAGKAESVRRFYDLLQEEQNLSVLRLALLVHDIGKGIMPGDHVRGSLETGNAILQRFGMPEPDREAVHFLIEHHLALSMIMNGRDLEDPATARLLTTAVGTQEHLRQLTLLTFADISAVNPTAMTPWRLEQLWRVYLMGAEQLTRELISDRIRLQDVHLADVSSALRRFLEGFPTRYLRTHTQQQIEHHFQLFEKMSAEGVAVEIESNTDAYLLTVVMQDEPGLFARICGALASFGMNILKAEAFSNTAGCALDTFRFSDPMHTLDLNPGEVNRLAWTVECVVRGSIEVSDLLKRRRALPRPSRGARIAPAVRFNNEASDSATLIDFTGEDRPGLLYSLASTLSSEGCNIDLVMIDTEAHKAIDVFYVTAGGRKLNEAVQRRLAAEMIRVADERGF